MSTPAFPAPAGLPPHPLSLGDVLSASFRFYGRRFVQLILIALIPTLVGLGIAVAAVALIVTGGLRLMGSLSYDGPTFDPGSIGLLVAGGVLLLALSFVAALVKVKCQGMIALAGRDIEDGRDSTIGDLWRRTRGLAGRAVLLILLLVLAVIVVAGVFGGLAVAINDSGSSGLGALLVVLAIALVVAAILLQVRWAFVLQTLAIDGDGPIASLGRSWRTSRGAFWRILGYLLVANILVSIAGGAVSGVTQGIMVPRLESMQQADTLPALMTQLASMAPFFLLAMVGGQIVSLLSGPFLVLFTTVLYIDQRRRLGLEAAPAGPQQWGPGFGAGGQPGGPYAGGPGPHPGGQGGPQGSGYPYGG